MLEGCSQDSFYLNGELIDINWMQWEARKPNGASNHRKTQAITKLKLVAENLLNGYRDADEQTISKWIKEAK